MPSNSLVILTLGDVTGQRALDYVCSKLRKLKLLYGADVVIVNGENASKSGGLDGEDAKKLLSAGADVITGGNHTLRGRRIGDAMEDNPEIIRPMNYPEACAGKGYVVIPVRNGIKLMVVNVAGQVYMEPADSPFNCVNKVLNSEKYDVCVADFHGEATSEKAAFARYFDGRINFTFGTHTHVQTADETYLPKGSGFITDLGMCGPVNSILGTDPDVIINRMVKRDMSPFTKADGDIKICGACVTINLDTGYVTDIKRIQYMENN
ncbi:MAG: YmdB family metallophosphoesterase [Ruminococcaceae bacterium]|nr:YmdB family metallophosphoesterase [Oscillospiraceae bacterium]